MGEDNKNHYHEFEITKKGLDLRQKAVAEGHKVDFTRGAIGEGRPEEDTDPFYMTELVNHSADVPIKESYASGNNHIMAVVIDGLNLHRDIMMTEIGIFARLLNASTGEEIIPEILYGYTYTDKYDYIPAGESYNLYREIEFDTVLSKSEKLKVVYDKSKVYITRKEFDEYSFLTVIPKGEDIPVSERKKGTFYLKITDEPTPAFADGEASVVIANMVASDTEPADKSVIWADTNN